MYHILDILLDYTHYDIDGCVICISSNTVEYPVKEGSYINSTKEVV